MAGLGAMLASAGTWLASHPEVVTTGMSLIGNGLSSYFGQKSENQSQGSNMSQSQGGGQIQIAQAVPETYRYVAGYVTKKMYELDGKKANAYYELGQAKPFACMSLKPGLGDHYYQEHKAEIWRQGYIQCTNGKQAQIPRYYEKQMEAENPQRLWRIKQNRQLRAIEQKRLQLENQDYKTVLETKERVTKKQTKKRGIL
jgi:hypothetical protein